MKKIFILVMVLTLESCSNRGSTFISKEFYNGKVRGKSEYVEYSLSIATKDSVIREIKVSKGIYESFKVGDTIR